MIKPYQISYFLLKFKGFDLSTVCKIILQYCSRGKKNLNLIVKRPENLQGERTRQSIAIQLSEIVTTRACYRKISIHFTFFFKHASFFWPFLGLLNFPISLSSLTGFSFSDLVVKQPSAFLFFTPFSSPIFFFFFLLSPSSSRFLACIAFLWVGGSVAGSGGRCCLPPRSSLGSNKCTSWPCFHGGSGKNADNGILRICFSFGA